MLGDEKDGMEVELQNLMEPRGRVPRGMVLHGRVPRGRVPRGMVLHGRVPRGRVLHDRVEYTVVSLHLSCYYIPLHN